MAIGHFLSALKRLSPSVDKNTFLEEEVLKTALHEALDYEQHKDHTIR
jgi:hypothetical protein